ncbi:MAG: UDP-glucose 4-epimerase, partial [Gaiellales bacterium]|nr:UDP-glucose 4-epimerase [Gaiellales bacterium]
MGANRTGLVTGSTGYVGRRLVARLAERGTPVRALVHRSRGDLPEGVEAVEGDVTDARSLA